MPHYSHHSQSPSDTVMRKMRHRDRQSIKYYISRPTPIQNISKYFARSFSKAEVWTTFPLLYWSLRTARQLVLFIIIQEVYFHMMEHESFSPRVCVATLLLLLPTGWCLALRKLSRAGAVLRQDLSLGWLVSHLGRRTWDLGHLLKF